MISPGTNKSVGDGYPDHLPLKIHKCLIKEAANGSSTLPVSRSRSDTAAPFPILLFVKYSSLTQLNTAEDSISSGHRPETVTAPKRRPYRREIRIRRAASSIRTAPDDEFKFDMPPPPQSSTSSRSLQRERCARRLNQQKNDASRPFNDHLLYDELNLDRTLRFSGPKNEMRDEEKELVVTILINKKKDKYEAFGMLKLKSKKQ
ncbi:hypothetical protein QE152_g1688 [Popillia japonica]|uniref:Uncharacterized protein n=1 Tax=Popillia japonica TaxID=7064 RepID=A0AAW1N4A6_POPJA